jgi:alpha-1,6-mannosyltransferase
MLLTFVAVVIRAEIFGLLGLLMFQLLLDGSLSFTPLVKVGVISGLVSIGMRLRTANIPKNIYHHWSLALTVSIDSYFWDQWPLWPEVSSIYFNVYEGKSADWGVRISLVSLSFKPTEP